MDLFGTHEETQIKLVIDAWGTEALRKRGEKGYSRASVLDVILIIRSSKQRQFRCFETYHSESKFHIFF
jgi:hypothetical protein